MIHENDEELTAMFEHAELARRTARAARDEARPLSAAQVREIGRALAALAVRRGGFTGPVTVELVYERGVVIDCVVREVEGKR